MTPLELAAALVTLALQLVAALWLRRIYQEVLALEDAVTRASARGQEQALRLAALDRLKTGQQLAEQAIGTGTQIARDMHLGIANIPFSILENIPPTAPTARVVRKLHDSISRDIYAALSGLNQNVGKRLRGDGKGGPAAPDEEPPT